MKVVKQIKNSCFLACLESFLNDNNIFIEQSCMIKVLSNKGLCAEDGVVYFENMNDICKTLNIKICAVNYHYPIENMYKNGSLLIVSTVPGFHCMRFYQQNEPEKIVVMDPAYPDENLRYCDKQETENSKPNFYHIEIFNKM
ncbi:MAG: hypothetical protein ACOYLO_12935 [Ferruginibacter sp.]